MTTARCQYTAAVLSCHSLTEAMLVYTATIVGLKCSFHLIIFFLMLCAIAKDVGTPHLLGCKITHNFPINKELTDFSPLFICFFIKM